MRQFRCPVTVLNTIDHLGKFDGKANEWFFVGYSTNSKAFRVFNSRIRIVEENLHVKFSKDIPNIARSGPNWLFDIDALTKSINYEPVVVGNQSNGSSGIKACDDAGKARMETIPGKDYILLPFLTQDPSFSSSSKDTPDAGFKPSGEEEKKDAKDPENEDSEVPNIEEPRVNQEQDANVNSTNNINIVSPTVNAADIEYNAAAENIVYRCNDDPNMPNLEEIVYSDDDEGVDAKADMTNLDTNILVNPTLTTRIHKDHPLEQIIRDIHSAPQTRRMTKNVTEHVEPKKVKQALQDPSWIEAMQEELLDEKGIVIKNKARFVTQGYTQEEGIDYDKVFALVARIEAIRLFLAYVSFKDFVVYQMDVKSAFLYGKIDKEVYLCQPPGFEDLEFPDKVYKVEKALYGLHQVPRAWYETLSTYLLDNGFQRGQSQRFQVTPKVSHLHVVKRIFRYLKGQPKLGLWYTKDSPFDLEAYTDNDYAGLLWTGVMDSKLNAGFWIQFHKYQIFIDNESTICVVKNPVFHLKTKHIKIRHHFIRDSYEKRLIQVIKIHTDHNVADLLTKACDGTDSGSGPRCQDTILRGAESQIRFEAASKQSNDPPFSRVNTLGSREDSMKLKELMEFCTKLFEKALDL
ncbi:ribonuclease H-like domain-containing protein [Tanacetum coccineum]